MKSIDWYSVKSYFTLFVHLLMRNQKIPKEYGWNRTCFVVVVKLPREGSLSNQSLNYDDDCLFINTKKNAIREIRQKTKIIDYWKCFFFEFCLFDYIPYRNKKFLSKIISLFFFWYNDGDHSPLLTEMSWERHFP